MPKFEYGDVERFEGSKYKDCLLKKLTEFKSAFQSSEMKENVDKMMTELNKIRPEQIMHESHYGHIVGQLNAECGYTVRLKKLKEKAAASESKEDELRAAGCEQMVREVEAAILDYLDLCTNNRDYFYGEISSRGGYFEDKNIIPSSDKKIEALNAKEFVLASRDILEEKNKNKQ